MKKLLFVTNNLEIGGVQTSLLNLVREIAPFYRVTVLTLFDKPEYRRRLPENVGYAVAHAPMRQLGLSKLDTAGKPLLYLERVFWFLVTKFCGRSRAQRAMALFQPKLKGYDCAISFLHEGSQNQLYGGCNDFVLNCVEADRKIGWIHGDFRLCGGNTPESQKIYEKFDRIVACSQGTRAAFLQCFPQFHKKCVTIGNCSDYASIRALAGSGAAYDPGALNFVTVARLAQEKGLDRAIRGVKACVEHGFRVQYHLVGTGAAEGELKQLTRELELTDCVFFHGSQENPYPYLLSADALLLCSYHEAAPMVFDEALSLGVPVLATETTSTEELITSRGGGYVCPNCESSWIALMLDVAAHPEKLTAVRNSLKGLTFNNRESVKKFRQLV